MRPNDTKKPDKPRDDFPLYAHGSGRWAKKIRQKLHYFGPWSDPQAALEKWLREKDYLLSGKKPPAQHDPDALTVKRLCDLFCESVERRVETGERSPRTLTGYVENAKRVAEHFGRGAAVEHLTPAEFSAFRSKLAKGVSVKTLEGRITCCRAVFNFGAKNGLIDKPLPKLWGTEFEKPDRAALAKEQRGVERLFTADEIKKLMDAAEGQVKAMLFLGINGALGPTDIAMIRFDDIHDGWLTLARNKTGKPRRIALWSETLEVIEQAKRSRPTPKDEADSDILFITKYKRNWLPDRKRFPLSQEFKKLQRQTGITGKGKSFYSLRHTFQTIGDETRDFVAVSQIMGHIDSSISAHYRERIGDDRLQAVTDHVRQWLFPKAKKATKKAGKGGAK